MKNDPKIIVACDFFDIAPVRELTQQLDPKLCRLKIGNILFTRYGPTIVEEIMHAGYEVFLDLKYHDIPNTAAGACCSASELGVWMINLHVTSGATAMQTARQMVDSCKNKPLLIGVTVLTSLSQQDLTEMGVNQPLDEQVLQLASSAKQHQLDGVVCSAHEAAHLRQALGDEFILVTPGIRLETVADDQKRTMTPAEAIAAGASYLVVGRPITQAADPGAVLATMLSHL